MLKLQLLCFPAVLILAIACRGGGDASEGEGGVGGGEDGLGCPYPAKLPFKLESSKFRSEESSELAELPRNKDEASDVLANTAGEYFATTMALDEGPRSSGVELAGRKARAPMNEGLVPTPILAESVSLWAESEDGFMSYGRQATNEEGRYQFNLADFGLIGPHQRIYSVLEGDGSCSAHHLFTLPAGAKIVITDIDGTLTLSDSELFSQISDGNYKPKQNTGADRLMKAWAEKGYQPVYLTARPHLFRSETRAWLEEQGFPAGPIITANQLVFGNSARTYKGTWVKRIQEELGWVIAAAYGNADSDINAYEDGGILKELTFIIGEHAGTSGTMPIAGADFSGHIQEFVAGQPSVN